MSDIRMGGSSVFTSTLGIKFADGTTQITAAFGTWILGMPYVTGNTVYFGGSYWAALSSSTGSIPSTSNPDWMRFTPSGLWNPLSSYAVDSEVTYLGENYIAISPSGPTTTTPDLNPTAWTLLGGNATAIQGVPVSPILPDHNGELLIYDSVSNSYVPGDPLVQGLFPEGTATSGINPILVAGKGADGLLHALSVDNSGNLNVDVTFPGTMAVTGTFWQATQPVSGTFWQATQPVSIAGTVVVSLASTTITGSVAVTGTFWQATQPVSGTFWQATQPVSGAISFTAPQHVVVDSATLGTVAVSGTFWQATQPVSGTFWQATQPVSGTVAISGSVAVTGTFWQATQPISGAISFTAPQHVIIDSATLGTVAVSGTFWQATQPVSSTQLPVALDGSGFLKVHEQGTVPVTGTFWQATQPVSIASMPSTPVTGTFWQTTQPVSGAFYQTTQPVSGTFWQATQPISGAISFTAPQHVINDASTAVIGHVIADSGSTTVVTGNVTVIQPTGANLHVVIDPAAAASSATIGSVSLGTSTGKTVVCQKATLNSTTVTADQVILTYTVTAGKTFYLEYVSIYARLSLLSSVSNTIFGDCSLENPSGTKLITFDCVGLGFMSTPSTITFAEPLPIAAGTVIRMVCTPANGVAFTWHANFGGYEK
jgi:hypothetical protein